MFVGQKLTETNRTDEYHYDIVLMQNYLSEKLTYGYIGLLTTVSSWKSIEIYRWTKFTLIK